MFSLRFLKDFWARIIYDDVFTGAAALGYYLTLAIFPALIVLMSVIPFLPIARVDDAIFDFLQQGLPQEAAGLVMGVVEETLREQRGGLLSFSLAATAWTATLGMAAITRQINRAYDATEARGFLRARATAFALSVAFAILVIGAFTLIVLGGVIQDTIGERFGFSGPLLLFFATLRWVIIVFAMLLGFALIYRFGPNLDVRFTLFSAGSVFGVAIFILASLAVSLYTQNFADYEATYGSIGAVIVLMLWLYVAGWVIIAGAEMNAQMRRYRQDAAYDNPPGAAG